MLEENIKYHQEVKIPIRIIQSTKMISDNIQKEKRRVFQNNFPKKAGLLLVVSFVFLSQVLLLSAFEAHIINVTARICVPYESRTPGYWKTHPEVYDPYLLPEFLGDLEGDILITNSHEADNIFWGANAKDMRDKLKAHLLAMKFNILHYGIGSHFVDGSGMTIDQIVNEADNILRDPTSTREEQEAIKNLLDYLNNLGEDSSRQCLSTPSWFDYVSAAPEPCLLTDEMSALEPQIIETITCEEEMCVIEESFDSTQGEPFDSAQGEPPVEEPSVEELSTEEPFDTTQGEPPAEPSPVEPPPPAESPSPPPPPPASESLPPAESSLPPSPAE